MSPFAALLARGSYFDGFVQHWAGAFRDQNSIVLLALGLGAVGVFIITRSRKK